MKRTTQAEEIKALRRELKEEREARSSLRVRYEDVCRQLAGLQRAVLSQALKK